jgi:hypothetical protein
MNNPGLPESLWLQLAERLWHATDRTGLSGIISNGEIKVGFGKRYRGSFCRHQGGVSLFDFGPSAEDLPTQFNNWSGWLGDQQDASVAVWLEIDRAFVLTSLSDAKDSRNAWKELIDQRCLKDETEELGITIIPGVEACHKGPVPLAAIVDVLVIARHDLSRFLRLGSPRLTLIQDIDRFEATLPQVEENPIVKALLAGRSKAGN